MLGVQHILADGLRIERAEPLLFCISIGNCLEAGLRTLDLRGGYGQLRLLLFSGLPLHRIINRQERRVRPSRWSPSDTKTRVTGPGTSGKIEMLLPCACRLSTMPLA